MSQLKQVILIPYWVQETLSRNQMPLADCLDFEKLKPVMSLSDLVTFSTLQHYVGACTGLKDASIGSLFFSWIKSIPESNRDTVDYLTKTVSPLEQDESFHNEVKARLFNPEAKVDRYQQPFIVMDLSPEVAGVVIYPGFFSAESSSALQQDLLEAILKVLYVYNTHNEVAKSPLFRRFLELLSKKQIIV